MLRLGPLTEVILFVQDMPRMVAFYSQTLGLPVRYPAGRADYAEAFWVELDSGPCALALHAGGQGRRGADAPKFVFSVEDIQAARQALLERGVALGEIRSAAPGIAVCDGADPEGNHFSLEQRGPGAGG
jgi:catechol 2,3-dioxygenase-like lactoylglutathione lyase family enzyme